jgi:SAM-dependent methyltransferase
MGHATSKAVMRFLHDVRYATRYFVGAGIDIGAGPDPLGQFTEFFPLMTRCRAWDVRDGDAQKLIGVPDGYLDFVYSSHCLEHMNDPDAALSSWLRVLRPGGHLVAIIPDEDMYEQGHWPSKFNTDHKFTFTIYKGKSWSPVSINLIEMVVLQCSVCSVLKLERLDSTYMKGDPKDFDQTAGLVGECAIEMILRKL